MIMIGFVVESRNWTEYTLYYTHLLKKKSNQINPKKARTNKNQRNKTVFMQKFKWGT